MKDDENDNIIDETTDNITDNTTDNTSYEHGENQEVTHANSKIIPQATQEVVNIVEHIVTEDANNQNVNSQLSQQQFHNNTNYRQNATRPNYVQNNASIRDNDVNSYQNINRNPNQDYFYNEELKKPKKRKTGWGKLIVSSILIGVVGGGSIGAGYGLIKHTVTDSTPMITTQLPIVATPVSTRTESFSAVDVIKAVKPTVVSIATQSSTERQYFGTFSVPYESEGAGSGVIFYSDSERVAIATNNHVIDEATSIFITFSNGEEEFSVPAKVAGTKSDSDLAVITVNWEDLEEKGIYAVSVATFGNSDKLEVGDPVFAIGNAMDMGISATDGIISMTEQRIYIEESELVVLQTSAAINSGNSGGALVNSAGEVIGINTAKYNSSKTEGMGYAIPSNEIVPIIEELLLNGTQPKPYVGITGTSITADNAALYRLPVGALIMEVTENGPAYNAGIQVGDIITQFDGKTVMDMEALINIVSDTPVNSEVSVHIIRNGEESIDLNLIVGDKNL